MIGSSLGGNITQFLGLEYQDQIGCLGVFSSANWLHQDAFNHYIERKKLYADQRIYIYVGTEEADDTDKTLMAGNIKQAYIDSSLRYYHDVIQQGVELQIILPFGFNLVLFTMKKLGLNIYQNAFAFWLKIGINGLQNKAIEERGNL